MKKSMMKIRALLQVGMMNPLLCFAAAILEPEPEPEDISREDEIEKAPVERVRSVS